MDHDDRGRIGRREMVRRSLLVLAAVPAATALGCGGGGLTCDPGTLSAEQSAMRRSLHYSDHAQTASRACSGCALYTGSESACGTCSVVSGAIHPAGTCDSFVARS
jgi:hypothetical protein